MAPRCILITFLALSLAPGAIAQRDQGGFIKPGDSIRKSLPSKHIIFLPEDGLSFYEFPSGAFKGKILPGPPLGLSKEQTADSLLTSTITGVTIRPQLLYPENYFEASDSTYYLAFDQQKDNHVLIFSDSFKGWVSLDEISEKGFELVTWMDFYSESKGRKIHPLNKMAPIYLTPNPDSKIIETADELYSEISTTGRCVGIFCYVNVTQYRNPYDPGKTKEDNVLKKYKGWIQIIDENGKPLVAHNSNEE